MDLQEHGQPQASNMMANVLQLPYATNPYDSTQISRVPGRGPIPSIGKNQEDHESRRGCEDVRMISAEAPIVFARACKMFILELTLRSWNHAEENKRRALQKNDIAAAITRTDIFDILVDIFLDKLGKLLLGECIVIDKRETFYLKVFLRISEFLPYDQMMTRLIMAGIVTSNEAPRAWFEKFSTTVISLGFSASNYDSGLFTRTTDAGAILLLLYVDDMIITGSDSAGITILKQSLSASFEMKDLGNLHYFLGLEVLSDSAGTYLCQAKYTSDLISRAGITDQKVVSTPLEPNLHLTQNAGPPLKDPTLYRQLVGSLVYLTVTRPDIAYAVHTVSQFMFAPCSDHYAAVLHILRYLKGTMFHGLYFSSTSFLILRGFFDADWDSDMTDRRSTTGFYFFLGDSLISWRNKKQSLTARSTTTHPTVAQLAQQQLAYQQIQQQQQQHLQSFWANQYQKIENVNDFKNHNLPLARIKKIMKVDEDVRMISAEAPIVLERACEMFILELTLRSWNHTEENKRRTLQKIGIVAAITRTDIFDFLVDIVPREDTKDEATTSMPTVTVPVAGPSDMFPYYYMSAQQSPQSGTPGMMPNKPTPLYGSWNLATITSAASITLGFIDAQE
ncbi:hypothetical protein OSB04_027830 [Centaurea solstitialis]|uniref:Uncharacterized protein n=1 Tax=Centaurea solstitialis TaxID=347529 RepID=A0AA38W8N1_9ASTR|nr:hypothetical protein OSB04_027830 [Centaurea solstitialis]